jgi:pimeloyl-ACP methyl ester carboxylesterase
VEWSPCEELNRNLSQSALTTVVGPFEAVECGTLPVPLDYTDPESPPLDLDLFRIKATKEPSLGTVIFNPGGPGGTAGENFPFAASDLRTLIGEQYDLVSFDPRGTGQTIPFNGTDLFNGIEGAMQKRDVSLPNVNMTEFFLDIGWDAAGLMAESVVAANNETGSLIGSAFVARDMLKMVDALCEDGMLRYYGWSYGTVLGSYFAAMFPDRVERMVLDANLDPADYRDGHWGDSLHDADKTFEAFLDACIENKEDCALTTFLNATSSQEIFDAINSVVTPLVENVTDIASFMSVLSAKSTILPSLYWPSRWPLLAENLVIALNATINPDETTTPDSDTAANSTEPAPWAYDHAVYSIYGIRGSDTTFKPQSAEEYLPQVAYQSSVSGFSDAWYFNTWISARWKMPAKEQFYGEFKAKTKNPILYVNGEYDPVTPLVAAQRASKGFEGSRVLSHGGYGHGAIADPSKCVHEYVRKYFEEGKMPEEGAKCEEADLGPWELAKVREGRMMGALGQD